jgi:hypothetical protein
MMTWHMESPHPKSGFFEAAAACGRCPALHGQQGVHWHATSQGLQLPVPQHLPAGLGSITAPPSTSCLVFVPPVCSHTHALHALSIHMLTSCDSVIVHQAEQILTGVALTADAPVHPRHVHPPFLHMLTPGASSTHPCPTGPPRSGATSRQHPRRRPPAASCCWAPATTAASPSRPSGARARPTSPCCATPAASACAATSRWTPPPPAWLQQQLLRWQRRRRRPTSGAPRTAAARRGGTMW